VLFWTFRMALRAVFDASREGEVGVAEVPTPSRQLEWQADGAIMEHRIEHVSDTALLVAASRARESERPDGLIRDPFAARLAGERGLALLRNAKTPAWIELGMGLRTHLLDELLTMALAQGVDAVLSLGAGLDARAWRMDLPANLRWTEVDFPAMLDYKSGVLEGAKPRCRLERRSADLNRALARRTVIEEAALGAKNPLLICEGLLMYLSGDTVHALAEEAHAAGFRYWLLDSESSAMRSRAHGDAVGQINQVRSEGHLEGAQVREAIEEHGWKPLARRLYVEEGPKLAGERILKIIASEGRPMDAPPDDGTGVWLYEAE
jgi:methyltransferase (TIGR00027 family)